MRDLTHAVLIIVLASSLASAQDELDFLTASEESAKQQEPAPEAVSPTSRSTVIEEVVVTAQKREENILDVPISISAVDGETLRDANINTLNDVSLFTPNVKLQVTPNSQFINIRGLGTGENRGFEQSVGLIIDGVYYGRADYMLGGLLDVDRIEVLRGPQGTLFGKNTIAGALNILTGIPEDEPSASVDALYGELDQRRVRAVATGAVPYLENLSARFAFEWEERDGYIFNNEPREHQANVDNMLLRAKLRWLPWNDLEMILGYDRTDVEQNGDGYQLSQATDASLLFYRQFDPRTETNPRNFFTTTDDERSGGVRLIDSVSLNMNLDLGDYTLTSISGYSDLGIEQIADADFSAAPFIGLINHDDYRQFSQELRVLSPPGTIEFVAGLYYFQSDLVVRTSFDIAKDGDGPLLAGALGAPNSPAAGLLDTLFQGGGVIRDQSNKHFDQDASAYAAFGQATWHVTDRWSLIAGLRYGYEKKEVALSNSFQATGILFQAILGEEPYDISRTRSEDELSPKASVTYSLTDDVNLYGTYAKGFKSGGFNQFAPTAADVDFGPENATTIEAGVKARLLDGSMRLNVGYFHTDFDDLQVTIFNGTQFVVGNAAKAITQGVEMDGMWIPHEAIALTFSGGWTDAEYDQYRDGPCWADGNMMAGPNPRERDEDGACFQNLSGQTLHRAPEFNAAVGADFGWPLGSWPVQLIAGINVVYQDDTFLNLDLDPVDYQEAFTQLNGRVGLRSADDQWSLTVFGRNLTDEVVLLEAADVPLFEGDHFSRQDLARTIAGELRLRF